jgi:hypothetical protein
VAHSIYYGTGATQPEEQLEVIVTMPVRATPWVKSNSVKAHWHLVVRAQQLLERAG